MSRTSVVSDGEGGRSGPAQTHFSCTRRRNGLGTISVDAAGVLDRAGARELDQMLSEAQADALLVVLDLHHLTFIDRAGEDAIVSAAHRSTQLGRQLVVLRGEMDVRQSFSLPQQNGRPDRAERPIAYDETPA
jgi:anti-anti-sigma factor